MCYIIVNEVMLGKRNVGFECYSTETEEIIGFTEKQIKENVKSKNNVIGCSIDEKGSLVLEQSYYKNIMCKTGISKLTPKIMTNCVANIIFSVVNRIDKEYEVISSRFWHGRMKEEKIKALYELGAVNGISIDSKGKVWLFGEIEKSNNKKEEIGK